MSGGGQGYRGYCTHNPFGEYRIPVPAQNIIYRDYAKKHGLNLKLSINELFFPNCFLQLQSLLTELNDLEGVLMCSIFMFPIKKRDRELIYKKLELSKSELHFIFENLILKSIKDFEKCEQLLEMRNQLKFCLNINDLKRNI